MKTLSVISATIGVVCLLITGCASDAPTIEVSQVDNSTERVIVVGAGFAGLTAARMLHDSEMETVVLEARDRIGGRTHTAKIAGAPFDLGGAWIHGHEGNPIADLAEAYGVEFAPHPYDVERIVDEEAGEVGMLAALSAYRKAEKLLGQRKKWLKKLGEDASVGDALNAALADYDEDQARLIRFLAEMGVELEYSSPVENMSLKWIEQEDELDGGDQVLDGGYIRLLEPLADGLDVRLSNPVTSIAYSDDSVTVTTKSGETHTGSHVLVTVPLGVLQAGKIAFDPPLPEAKQHSIDALEMGSLEKVIFRFEEVFWDKIEGQSGAILRTEEPGRFPFFIDFTEFAGAPALVCLHGGDHSRRALDTLSDEAIIAEATMSLELLLGETVPKPIAVRVTRWRSDPFSLGSYSNIPPGASPDDLHQLALPVADRVLFAGEATYYDFHGTVHAAILSGIREAKRLGANADAFPPR